MEFYSLPNSDSVPAQKSRIPREVLRVGMIIALTVLVCIIGFLVLKKRSGDSVVISEVRQEIAACETEGCAIVYTTTRAKETNDSSLCKLVGGDGVASCIKQYAYDELDPSACERLVGEEKEVCISNAYYLLARSKKDIQVCDSILDENLKENCLSSLGARFAHENRCSEAGSFKDACQKIVNDRLNIAKQIGVGLCDPFMAIDPELGEDGEQYGMCLYALDNVDLDGDGLVIRQEITIGTDNQNRDTDGDGFDDGTEVRGGYNPLGV